MSSRNRRGLGSWQLVCDIANELERCLFLVVRSWSMNPAPTFWVVDLLISWFGICWSPRGPIGDQGSEEDQADLQGIHLHRPAVQGLKLRRAGFPGGSIIAASGE